MEKVSEYREFELTREQFYEIAMLENGVWPHPVKSVAEQAREAFEFAGRNPDPRIRRFLVWEEERALAHTRIFPRTITTASGALEILALAGVCVLAEKRGEGYGRLIVERVFRVIDRSDFPLALFQTGVPGFYRKLGAKNISNQFYNSR